MDWSETFRDRYYSPGYVYIAGSLSQCVLKIGTTINIGRQQSRLRRTKYGNISDWELLYYVFVSEGGRIEHDARRNLKRYSSPRIYDKEGHRQKAREIVNCGFGVALEALASHLSQRQLTNAWKSSRANRYEFEIYSIPMDRSLQSPLQPEVQPPPYLHLVRKIDELEITVRTSNCLHRSGIRFLGELVQKSEQELLLIPNSGLKTLNEVKEILSGFKLQLGQPITNWPPRNLEQLSLRVDNLLEPVEYLELSIRTANCLRDETIQFVGELVQISEDDMLKKRNFGQKSLNELNEILAEMGLEFGIELPHLI